MRRAPLRPACHRRTCRGPARRPDGKLRGRPHDHRRRPGDSAGPASHRCRRGGRLARAQPCSPLIDGAAARERRPLPPDGAGLAGRCPLARETHGGARANPERPQHSGSAMHAFLDGRDVPPRSAIDDLPGFEDSLGDLPNVRNRGGRRPLLRHGPGPALGADCAGLRRGGLRRGPASGKRHRSRARELCGGHRRRVRRACGDRRLPGNGRRRRADHGQLPRGPRAPDHDGAARPGLRRLCPHATGASASPQPAACAAIPKPWIA